MSSDARDGALGFAIAEYRDSVLYELRSGSARWAIGAVFGFGCAMLLLAISTQNPIPPQTFSVVVGLLALAAFAHVAFRYRVSLAAATVICGLLAVLLLALRIWPASLIAPWAALVVLTAAIIAGRRYGVVMGGILTAILIAMTQQPDAEMTLTVAVNAILLSWACLLFYSAISWPSLTLLDWALSSYVQALEQTREARDRQAELARLSKGLSDYQYQLEQLNLELERARRAAQKAHELKAQFAASVSHELRTPLNLIIGFCEMMVLSPDSAYGQRVPASYRGDLETIYRNASHMSSLIDDILDLSQIDADRMAIHREWTALRQIVDEATSTVESLFRDRELTLQTAMPNDLPTLFVDRTRIRQILINILANAARFTEEGGVRIRAEQHDDSIIVTVSDTGPGIPIELQPYVFDEFRQVGGMKSQRGGSGLGLAVSKRFAELHGGTMSVESVPGQGSTFFLTLPLGIEAGSEESRAVSDWGDWVTRRVRGQADNRVLVLDESDRVRKVFERYLDGYQVLSAGDCAENHRLPKNAPIHAILLGSEGNHSSLVRLQQSRPELQRVPVISYTLHTMRSLAGDMGVTDYLVKPVTRAQLRSALKRLAHAPRSVLVVDDDLEMNRLLVRMMHSLCAGCRIRTAEDGRQAIDLLREERPDVVLLDLLMPTVDGYAVVDVIHHDPTLGDVPVVVVTARGLQDETMVASTVSLSREGGLTVGEMMRWLTGGLDALLQRENSAPESPAAPVA